MIKCNFQDISVQTILPLYKSVVRPKIEYCIKKKDIERLERVQKKATRLVNGFRHLPYDELMKDFQNWDWSKLKICSSEQI